MVWSVCGYSFVSAECRKDSAMYVAMRARSWNVLDPMRVFEEAVVRQQPVLPQLTVQNAGLGLQVGQL